jgi:RND family efflux transporter MFP subunit
MNASRLKSVAIALAVVAVVATVLGVYIHRTSAPDKAGDTPTKGTNAAARAALTVTTTQPVATQLPIKLSANGNIAAWQEASVGTESNGLRLAEVLVNVGDVVQRGQALARFADDSVQADVAQARAGVAETGAQATEATANANRVRTLLNTGTFSGQQISQYLAAEQTALARVESAKAVLAAQLLRLKNTQVLAPDAGIISARSATVGAVVPSGTELFRLIRQGRLEWRAEMTSTELARIAPGTPVAVVAANGARLEGRVRMVAPTVDPQTRAGLVYVDLPPMPMQSVRPAAARAAASSAVAVAEAPQGALPGMFARGEFDLGRSSALTVPQQAVVVRDGFSYVFRLNADQRVSQIKVELGRRVGDRVELLDGIGADAVVIATGAGFLNEGDLVKVAPAPAPAATAATAAPPALAPAAPAAKP